MHLLCDEGKGRWFDVRAGLTIARSKMVMMYVFPWRREETNVRQRVLCLVLCCVCVCVCVCVCACACKWLAKLMRVCE